MAEAGQVLIFTGDGKGKTTAALGLAITAAAKGQQAAMVQFLKGGGYSGELFAQELIAPYFIIRQFGYGCHLSETIRSGKATCNHCGECFRQNREPGRDYAGQALTYAAELLRQGTELLVLDEVSHAIHRGLLPLEKVVDLVGGRLPQVTIILTGRNMPERLLTLADQITECFSVKHPIEQGIDARRGSEY